MIVDLLVAALLILGVGFMVVGVVGFVRFPDELSRLHAVSLAGTLGFVLIAVGLAIYAADLWAAIEYGLITVLLAVASATVGQGIAWFVSTGQETPEKLRHGRRHGRQS